MLKVRRLAVAGLDPFDLDLDDGECVALGGPSGSGKTLILRALADLDPNHGAVALDGEDRAAMPAPAWRRRVSYLAAEPAWWGDTVGDHFADRDAARPLAAAFGLADALLDQAVATVSTGERKRLALVRTLVRRPEVLLLDEPTSGLDEAAADRVAGVLGERLGDGAAMVLVSHEPAIARRLARRHIAIRDGRVEAAS